MASATETPTIGADETVKEYIVNWFNQHEPPPKVAAALLKHYAGNAHDAESILWSMWEKIAGPFTVGENGGGRANQKSGAALWIQEVISCIVYGHEDPKVARTSRYDLWKPSTDSVGGDPV